MWACVYIYIHVFTHLYAYIYYDMVSFQQLFGLSIVSLFHGN